MTTASQSGFTNMLGTVPSNISDGNANTGWSFDLYTDNTGKVIQFDTGGWFDGSTLARSHIVTPSRYLIPAGGFALQLSSDGTNWFNMPDNTGSVVLGIGNDVTTNFTPWPDNTHFRYIRFIGTGGSYDLPAWTKAHGYLSYLTFYTTMEFLTASGAALTIDTSGGSNPTPPTAPPDTDGGAAITPDPPPDSHVPARTSSTTLTVLRSDPGEVRVTAIQSEIMRSDPGVVHVSAVSLSVMSLVHNDMFAAFIDDATLTATPVVTPPAHPTLTNFKDEATLTAAPTIHFVRQLSADFTDEAVFDAFDADHAASMVTQLVMINTGRS